MLCALSVAFLWLSGILPLSTYFWPILASAALLPAREECRKSYAWSCFAAAAILGLLLCADKEAALLFCFLGYYPLLKPKIDAISSKVLRLLLKVALLCVELLLARLHLLFLMLTFVVLQIRLVLTVARERKADKHGDEETHAEQDGLLALARQPLLVLRLFLEVLVRGQLAHIISLRVCLPRFPLLRERLLYRRIIPDALSIRDMRQRLRVVKAHRFVC